MFFNLKELERISGNDTEMFLSILYYLATGKLNKYKPRIVHNVTKLSIKYGNSFILNPIPVLEDKVLDINFKVQYLKLAGMRDYFLYKQYGTRRLQRRLFPDLNIQAIKHNPLLRLTDAEVIFKHEENYGNTKVRAS